MVLNNKKKTPGQLIIDLTPLLDVIFILLIVVLSFQDNFIKQADEKTEAARSNAEKAEETVAQNEEHYAAVQQQLENYEQLYDFVNIVTIYAGYSPADRRYRTLHVVINGGEQWEKEINPSNEENVWAECKNYIESTLSGKAENPTVFSIKDEKMLYRDEQSILKLYEELNLPNKYEKNYMETEDE